MLGVVAATITVPDERAFDRAAASELVYVIDLSVGEYKRDNPGVTDVTQNDVYWNLAGWDS